jgi:hypothetical protein
VVIQARGFFNKSKSKSNPKRGNNMRSNFVVRLAQIIVLCAAVSATAFAQYPGGTGGGGTGGTGGYTAPNGGYGSGKAIGIGVGVAAAVAGIALYVHHRHKVAETKASLVDWTMSAHNGFTGANDKVKHTNSRVTNSAEIITGEYVELTGEKPVGGSGNRAFRVQDVLKETAYPADLSKSNALAPSH